MNKITTELTADLSKDELVALRQGRLQLHCSHMKLEQTRAGGLSFSGPGLIEQGTDGQLAFTQYAGEVVGLSRMLEEMSGRHMPAAGQILTEDVLYRLAATDMNGREWKSSHIRAYTQAFPSGTLCTGSLQEINFDTELPGSQGARLHLEASGDIQLPANTPTQVTTTIGDKPSEAWSLNVLKHESSSHSFTFRKDGTVLLLDVTPKGGKLEDNLDVRMAETLQFLLARPIEWSLVQKWNSGTLEIRIRTPRRYASRPRMRPPIPAEIEYADDFCAMLDKYIAFVLAKQSGDRLHPISAQMRAICHASMGSIQAEAITLCVAVESILRFVQRSQSKLTPEERTWVCETAPQSLASWGCPAGLIERATDLIRMLNDSTSTMRLRELAGLKIVTDEQVKVWRDLRGRLVHGESFDSTNLQDSFDLTDKVRALFYQLVLHRIGYRGKYTDYSTSGWPTKVYSSPAADGPSGPSADFDADSGGGPGNCDPEATTRGSDT